MSSDKNYNDKNYEPENLGEAAETIDVDPSEEVRPEGAEVATDEEISEIETLKNLLQAKETEVEKEKKEYLFLMAEFDNFRKRTIRERSELVKNASEKALQGLLPIVDDFERGLDAIRDSSDAEAVKEGMNLIYNKLIKYLADNGVKAMESTGADFDTELHEAVAMVPADDVTPKGKVKDTVSKGYTINDKVLRHAKVVVAQ
ncbi:nucleotide exchange factor GrpE [Muribaculaceae bacterium Isolate-013 (NCI)]|nr:nucleotide exchange factor GrpE [Muribaculaceae bacterium Isolate-013 (NCI)]